MTRADLLHLAHLGKEAGWALYDLEEMDRRSEAVRRHPVYEQDVAAAKQVLAEADALLLAEVERLWQEFTGMQGN